MEMMDNDYKFNLSEIFLSKTGHTFNSKKGISEYYPIISISLKKEINEESGDETNWNGSIYYEEKIEILDEINNSIATLKSHLSESARVLYSIRSISDIGIRIVLPFVSDESVISIEELNNIAKKTINQYRGFNDNADFSNLINLYHTEFTTSQGFKTFSFDISPILDRVPNILPSGQVLTDSTSGAIIDNILKSEDTNNEFQLLSVYNNLIREILSDINKKYKDIKLGVKKNRYDFTYQFYITGKYQNKILFETNYWFDEFRSIEIPIGKKPIFGSRKKQRIQIYKMGVKLDFKF
jgi:hypothetical protein